MVQNNLYCKTYCTLKAGNSMVNYKNLFKNAMYNKYVYKTKQESRLNVTVKSKIIWTQYLLSKLPLQRIVFKQIFFKEIFNLITANHYIDIFLELINQRENICILPNITKLENCVAKKRLGWNNGKFSGSIKNWHAQNFPYVDVLKYTNNRNFLRS